MAVTTKPARLSFRTDEAAKHGVLGALLIDHVAFWCEKNSLRDYNAHEGDNYTYTSYGRLLELFPFAANRMKICRTIKALVEADVMLCVQRQGKRVQGGRSIMLALNPEYRKTRGGL